MKIFWLRAWAVWRRFRRGATHRHARDVQYSSQVESLMRRANPFAGWNERANWMIDVADWLRREPKVSLLEAGAWRRAKQQRTRLLLNWLDAHRETRRVVQKTIQKTLREAVGPELFCATGLPHEPAFFSELVERTIKLILPKPPAQLDISMLFTAMFPDPSDAEWLLGLDRQTLSRVWKLSADSAIAHAYQQQIDEALLHLVTSIVSVGIGPAFRRRLGARTPLQATPFMVLRRELENLLMTNVQHEGAVRSVRMLIAVCQAQTDKIYEHLDEFGVSVGLVYHVERMRAQLARMAALIELRAAAHGAQGVAQVQSLLAELIVAHHHRSSVPRLVGRSFSLLARKMVERNADHGERYVARDRAEYRAMLHAGYRGGFIVAFTALGKSALSSLGLARFFEGVFASLNFTAGFLTISAMGGVLAAKQPAVTAPALAAKMSALGTADGLRALLQETTWLLRSQAAAVFGNLIAVVPTMALLAWAVTALFGAPLVAPGKAHAAIGALSMLGATPLFAAFTGVLLWLSSLAAGFADNWFALRRLREALAHHRRLVHALGAARTRRWATWLERHVAAIAGNVSLAVCLGMTPVLAQFFGLPLEVRHVTLSSATLVAAACSLGWPALATPDFWLAAGGVALTALLNVGVAFACALSLAWRAREVPPRIRRLFVRSLLRRLSAAPAAFLFARRADFAREGVAETLAAQTPVPEAKPLKSRRS